MAGGGRSGNPRRPLSLSLPLLPLAVAQFTARPLSHVPASRRPEDVGSEAGAWGAGGVPPPNERRVGQKLRPLSDTLPTPLGPACHHPLGLASLRRPVPGGRGGGGARAGAGARDCRKR